MENLMSFLCLYFSNNKHIKCTRGACFAEILNRAKAIEKYKVNL